MKTKYFVSFGMATVMSVSVMTSVLAQETTTVTETNKTVEIEPAKQSVSTPTFAPSPSAEAGPGGTRPAVASTVQNQPVYDGSMSAILERAIERNPRYGIIAKTRKATEEELKQAKALYMPSIDLQADTGWERTDRGTINNESMWRNQAGLTLTQLLFDGYGVSSEIKRQKARVESSANRAAEVSEFLGLDIVESYLEVMRQRELRLIAQQNVVDHEKILDTLNTGEDAGTITTGDVSQGDARYALAKANLQSTEEALKRAEATFVQKAGEVAGKFEFPDVPRQMLPATSDESVTLLLKNSPTLAVLRSDVKVADAEYEGSGSTLYPTFTLEANANVGRDVNGIDGRTEGESVLGVMRWNLYRGGADIARQREFNHRLGASKDTYRDAELQAEKDMRDSWAGLEASSARVKEFDSQVKANTQVVSVYMDQFNLGRRTLLDLLDSQNELFVSKSNRINALYTEAFAVYRILALQGDLLASLNVQRPAEAQLAKKKK